MMTVSWISVGQRELLSVDERLQVFLEHVRLPDGREITDYLKFSTPPFVCMVAQTSDGRLICERQYKHGPGRVVLTLPAGAIEPEEEPLAAARRELLEETGYVSEEWQLIATRIMHANAGGTISYSFLARDCRKVAEPDSGDLEDMTIELLEPQAVLDALCDDQMPLVSDAAALLQGLLTLGCLKT